MKIEAKRIMGQKLTVLLSSRMNPVIKQNRQNQILRRSPADRRLHR